MGLLYGKHKSNEQCVQGFVDSDYASDQDNRRSLTGFVFQVFGCTVSWKASLQHVVSFSTTEAKYIAITKAVKEATWLQGLVKELGIQQGPVTVFCDSQSVIHLTKNQMYHERTKHIDVRLHFVRGIISEGKVFVAKVGTEDNHADMLTKALSANKFKHCLELLSVESTDMRKWGKGESSGEHQSQGGDC